MSSFDDPEDDDSSLLLVNETYLLSAGVCIVYAYVFLLSLSNCW
jgi:hypothetical protein